MVRYIFAKLFGAVAVLLVLTLVVFGGVFLSGDVAQLIIPQGPGGVTTERFLQLKEQYGLSDPFLVQYARYLTRLVTEFDFGTSLRDLRPVNQMLVERIPNTFLLAGTAMLLAIIVGVPLGVLSAIKRNSYIDNMARLLSSTGMAAPQFWVGIMLILLFAATLKLLPAYGTGSPAHLILPAVTVALPLMTGITRFVRSSVLDVLASEYVKFARIKGLRERRVLWNHAFRNAVIPLITFLGLQLAGVLNGSIVVEVVFAWPGLGNLMVESVMQRNMPVVQGTVLISALLYIAAASLVDIAYHFADPRIRLK
jgi:peptide/nickel transport system permease protein